MPASGQAPPEEIGVENLGPDQILVIATRLVAAGRFGEALVLLARLEQANAGGTERDFLSAMIALAKHDYRRAETLLRKILQDNPNAVRVRLELARTLFFAGKDEEADYHFKLAIGQKPPAAVVANITRFREAIRARRAWRFNVNLALSPDSNINSATDRSQVDIFGLPFQLDPAARSRSGTGIIVDGDGSVRLRRESKVPLYLAVYGRIVRYPDHDFDDIYVGGEAGPELRFLGGQLRVTATALNRWYGGAQLVKSLGGRLSFDKIIAGKSGLEAALAARHNDYARRDDLDGWDIEAAVSANRALSPSTLGFVYASAQRSFVGDPGQSNWQGRIGIGVLKEIGWGLRPQFGLEAGRQVNDAPLALFGRIRRDWRLQASASLYKRDWNIAGFAPSLRVVYSRNFSTIEIYDQKRLRVEFGIAKAF